MRLSEDLRRPSGFLSACLILLLAEGPGYGYELAQRLGDFNIEVDDPSHVYRALRALEVESLVESTWTSGRPGPARRVYRITPEGREALRVCRASLEGLSESVGRYLERLRLIEARRMPREPG